MGRQQRMNRTYSVIRSCVPRSSLMCTLVLDVSVSLPRMKMDGLPLQITRILLLSDKRKGQEMQPLQKTCVSHIEPRESLAIIGK